ncbi:MAG: type II toxin-antitoxin system RelE/ParE family toxin [Deltaproteobacteria bacterium]|jgi:addiction module RelE/StbE family toxin|nr:type II toxin-antitoxin system RelE/ParE family toxin [Deltaproteobacteria bacterium]
MTKYRVDVSESAENDLRDIVNYIIMQLSAPLAAKTLLETLEKSLFGLEDMPYSHQLVRDERLSILGYRKLIVKNYVIFFIINEDDKVVDIVRILYGRRNWLNIL